MATPKFIRGVAALATGLLLTAGAVAAPAEGATRSLVRIAIGSAPSSLNPNTSATNLVTNADIQYLTGAQFNYLDDTPKIVRNTKFGSYKVIRQQPFTVKYTVNAGQVWSDGTAIDAADLLLPYVTSSGFFDDAASGTEWKAADKGKGLNKVSRLPKISDDGRSVTFVYDLGYYSDWEQFYDLALPAHGVTKLAFPTDSAVVAKNRFLNAVEAKDFKVLKKIADKWNTAYNILNTVGIDNNTNPNLLITSGAYKLQAAVAKQSVTLVKNDKFKGGNIPTIKSIQFKVIDSSAQPQALENGEVDALAGSFSVDAVKQLRAQTGSNVQAAKAAKYEHVDLRVDSSSPWAGYSDKAKDLRKAFLATIPRETIIDNLVKPINPKTVALGALTLLPGQAGYESVAAGNGSKAYITAYTKRLAASKATLAKYGFTEANPLEVRLVFSANDTLRADEANLIAASAAKAGFKVTLNPTTTLGASRSNKNFDAHLYSWSRSDIGVTWAQKVFGYNAPLAEPRANNVIGYNNSALNKLVDVLEQPLTASQLAKQTLAIEKILYADGVQLSLYQHSNVTASTKALKGINAAPLSPNLVWNFWNWKY